MEKVIVYRLIAIRTQLMRAKGNVVLKLEIDTGTRYAIHKATA